MMRGLWAGIASLFFVCIFLSAGWGQDAGVTVFILDLRGKEICRFEAEAAVTAEEQQRGLMFRKYMPGRTGMIFINTSDRIHHFWMKNTYIPLDMIFIDSRFKVVHVHHNAFPHDEKLISSRYPARYILEVNAGEAGECSVRQGSKIRLVFHQNK